MQDKLKTLVKTLPTFEPRNESINQIVRQIVKRELRRWWEKRVSLLAGTISVISGYFVLQQMFKIGEILGTAGFWALVSTDKQWVLSDRLGVWEAFLEAHPWKEVSELFLLLVILVFSLYILLKKDE